MNDIPDEDVNLFVDDVEGENAETVFLLNCSGGTILVEGTLGYLGKYLGHGIGSVFRLHLGVGQNVPTVAQELPTEEEISEINLKSFKNQILKKSY